MKTIEIKSMNIEVTPVQKWTKIFAKIKIPKGFRLVKVWELMELLDGEQADEFLGEFKGQWNYFFCEQTNWAKKNNRLSRLLLFRNAGVDSCDGSLANSDDDGRVAFVKVKK